MFNSEVKESCFKHLQNVSAKSVCNVTLPAPHCNLVPSTALKKKSSEDKVVSEWERKVLPCFDVEI